MKKLLCLSDKLSTSAFKFGFNPLHKSLLHQSIYLRSHKYKKFRTLQSAKKNVKNQQENNQNKEDQPNQQNQNEKEVNQNTSDNNGSNDNNKNNMKVPLTGPNKLVKYIQQGKLSIVPFYVNNILNRRNPSLKIVKSHKSNATQHQTQQKNNSTQHPTQQKLDLQQKQSSQKDEKIEQKHQQIFNTIPNESIDKKYKIRVMTGSQYKKSMMKNYRVIQALKSSNRVNSYKTPFVQILMNLQKIQFKKLFLYANIIAIIIAAILTYFINSYQKGFKKVQQVKLQKTQDQLKQIMSLQDHQIFNKLSSIESITFKELSTNSMRKHLMQIKYKSTQYKSTFKLVFQKISKLFDIQNPFQNIQKFYTYQNPNSLLSGLEQAQQNISKQNWIQVMFKPKNYSIIDALKDTLFLLTPFIGVGITYWIFRKMNPDTLLSGMSSNKKSMKVQSLKDIKVRFKDVAGMQQAKKQITQFVDFLKKSDKYTEMGAKIPKGALLTGPPGTGKTMLAKACAGQAGTSFFYVSGSEFVQMFVGLGASRVRQLFAKARQEAPSIIFIDQIDAIGKKRQTSRNQEKDSTLNQLLVEMDGFASNQTVIVLAATNMKDVLDSALTRPGRFDRMVQVNLPDIKARQQIFMVHLAPLKVNPDRNLSEIAKRLSELSPGFSGADIANLCNEAAIIATRKQRTYIQDADFEQASQRIVAGYIKKGSSTANTKKRVAYHEAGHAVCGWYLKGGDPLVKLTIIPRSKGALGYAQYLPKSSYIKSKSDLIDQVAIMLGGTTSEQLFFGNMSSGASDDLQKVYQLTRRMVTQFGMGSQTYNVTLDEQRYVKKQSHKLCNLMDDQIMEIVREAGNRAKQILEQKKQIVDNLASQLLQKETINSVDIIRIMGLRPAFN